MELEVEGLTGATYGEKSQDRLVAAVVQEAYMQGVSTRLVDDVGWVLVARHQQIRITAESVLQPAVRMAGHSQHRGCLAVPES
jgi:hypothetical protein